MPRYFILYTFVRLSPTNLIQYEHNADIWWTPHFFVKWSFSPHNVQLFLLHRTTSYHTIHHNCFIPCIIFTYIIGAIHVEAINSSFGLGSMNEFKVIWSFYICDVGIIHRNIVLEFLLVMITNFYRKITIIVSRPNRLPWI